MTFSVVHCNIAEFIIFASFKAISELQVDDFTVIPIMNPITPPKIMPVKPPILIFPIDNLINYESIIIFHKSNIRNSYIILVC